MKNNQIFWFAICSEDFGTNWRWAWGDPDSFHKDWSVFGPQMVSKWISGDGQTFYILYSNFPNGPYKFNLQKATFKVAAY